jgi:succinate-semialdehyde dehydrogenase / glutarate-semialdehyde dehydrogenase
MAYASQNPFSGTIVANYPSWSIEQLDQALDRSRRAQRIWANYSFGDRARLTSRVADTLRRKREQFAGLISLETGKLMREARAEIEKCALACDYYAVHGGPFLEEEAIRTDAGRSYVTYLPLGTVLGIMPWNFPFWQVFRFAAGAIMAGNACIVKPASSGPQCGLAIEGVFRDTGFPEGLFTTALLASTLIKDAIADPRVHAVTLTGSEATGRAVAALAGASLKKCVLELGGSDAFIVLGDADLDRASSQALMSRFMNCGQSCIAAKRFILTPEIADEFVALFGQKISQLRLGDPARDDTGLGPMARIDLRDALHGQVRSSIERGAIAVLGCEIPPLPGAFYAPSLLDRVTPGMPAYHEELFGPVAVLIRASDEQDAIRIANDTSFGLGSSIWSDDYQRAERLSLGIEAGATFVNGIVRSDPRLPFGGIKASGFGRELSYHGIREFTNAKTVWVRDGYAGTERRQVPERRQGDRRQLGSNVISLGKS